MTGPHPPEGLPDLPWGKMAGVAGGLAATYLTVRGAVGVGRIAYRELQDRFFGGTWPSRRG